MSITSSSRTLILIFLASFLCACARPTPLILSNPDPLAPTEAVSPPDTLLPTPQPTPFSGEWAPARFPELGVSFEVPAAWQANQDLTWTPDGDNQARIGLLWAEISPGTEVEAIFLPPNSAVKESVTAEVNGLAGRRYTIEMYGAPSLDSSKKPPIMEMQTHVIVRHPNGLVYDFYAAGHTLDEMFDVLDELKHVLETLVWE